MTAGMLDETKVWATARSITEIASDIRKLVDVNSLPETLLAYYRYDDAGENIEDFCYSFKPMTTVPAYRAADYELKAADYKVAINEEEATYTVTVDGEEVTKGTSAWVVKENAFEAKGFDDADGDELPDWWEAFYNDADHGNTTWLASGLDTDGDNLSNQYEYLCRLSPISGVDTGNTGKSDANKDFDGDGLSNYEEQRFGANPQLCDTDDDGFKDKVLSIAS